MNKFNTSQIQFFLNKKETSIEFPFISFSHNRNVQQQQQFI